jgi:hypothetical protein
MLADASVAGAYYVDASGRDALLEAARALDFALFEVDLTGCDDKGGVLARIASTLGFPEWFGDNWDALSDSLNDLSWRPAEGYVLVIDHGGAWKQRDPVGFDVLLEIGNDVAEQWSPHGVPFWMLVPVPHGAFAADEDA